MSEAKTTLSYDPFRRTIFTALFTTFSMSPSPLNPNNNKKKNDFSDTFIASISFTSKHNLNLVQ